jgi:hypothetical protein
MSRQWQRAQTISSQNNQASSFSTLILSAGEEGVEKEKCVVSQYRTTSAQRKLFVRHLSLCTKDDIAIEWVIDIADDTDGWFYGTAYAYNDTNQMLHVMVPDKINPTFDGHVLLDYRSVHLIECVDGVTDALFNKIIRDSTVRIQWELDWFEEDMPIDAHHHSAEGDEQAGRWVESCARYYLRIANQVLIEDDEGGLDEEDSKGFVMLTADTNLRLKLCVKGKGQDDFDRLITDGSVLSTPDVLEIAKLSMRSAVSGNQNNRSSKPSETAANNNLDDGISVRKLADMSRGLKECLSELLDEREKTASYRSKMTRMFQKFAMSGDLDAGLNLLADAEEQAMKDEMKLNNEKALNNGGKEEIDSSEALADEAWILIQRLEKSAMKLLRAGGDASSGNGGASEELEFLRKSQRRMKKELEDKDRELQSLYAARAR